MSNFVRNFGKKILGGFGKACPKFNTKMLFLIRTHKWPNLKNPQTFNEKTTWLKLNDYNNNDLVSKCADKYGVREYVKSKGCDEILNEFYGVYNDFDEIDFDKLPNEFVIKCTHGCAYNIIVDSKNKFDKNIARKKIRRWKKEKYGYATSELHYTKIEPKIIIEKYLCDKNGKMPIDYKFYCVNGKVECILVCSERDEKLKLSYYDLNWNRMPYEKRSWSSEKDIKKPKNLKKMVDYAERLSRYFPFVRVDLYNDNGKIIFGELTFTPACSCAPYYNEDGNKKLGELLNNRRLKSITQKRKEKDVKILHITSIKNQDGNGVAMAIARYFKYEKKITDVAVFNIEESDFVADRFSYSISDYKSISSLPDGFDSPSIVVFNEVYKLPYLKLYKECINRKIPYIIIPHGCLTKLAQDRKKIKKKIANIFFFNKFIKKSLAIQYLGMEEKNNSIVKNHKYIISGNGVDVGRNNNRFKNKDFVYIGRYSIKHKGLDLLVDNVAKNKRWFLDNNIKVRLYGRDSNNDYKKLKKIIIKNDVSEIILLNDAVYGSKKEKILLDAYAFVQLSRWEGQPMGVLEALSFGLPCIVTFGTTFGEYINDNKCGIGVEFNRDVIFNAMKKMFYDENFRNKCAKNTNIIEKNYDWDTVSKKCLIEYEGLL